MKKGSGKDNPRMYNYGIWIYALLTEDYRRGPNRNLGRVLTILLDIPPPNADELLEEASGVGRVSVFLSKTRAEFKSLCINPGDKLFLDSLETNLLRVACDFYWADFICGFLDSWCSYWWRRK